MIEICVWCDSTWCYIEELNEFSHKSDDYGIYKVSLDDNINNEFIEDLLLFRVDFL